MTSSNIKVGDLLVVYDTAFAGKPSYNQEEIAIVTEVRKAGWSCYLFCVYLFGHGSTVWMFNRDSRFSFKELERGK